ncbi:MAG: RNA polymerase sigma factor [Bacteroidales bacterium]|jgi:RNA polymerase sigma-70 factor (ECF subfamily)|nr:RNA polymerase sigma factor [Bacteroidales bacterium]
MDKTVFNQLMVHLRPKMYRFALAFIKRTDEAEDVVQDVGIKLWERHKDLESLRSIEAYAMCAVKNRCLDYTRSPVNKTSELTEAIHTPVEQTPYKSTEQADMAAFVRKLIDRLPVQQQMTIRLRDVEGYELDEIAEILEMNEGTVRTNLSRARQKIREELLKQ